MKKLSLLGFGLLASLLAGCPIWSDNGSSGTPVCTDNCPPAGGCSSPLQCPPNETCGQDGQCHAGDCTQVGCAPGYTCDVTPLGDSGVGSATCVPNGVTAGVGGNGNITSTVTVGSGGSKTTGPGGAATTTGTGGTKTTGTGGTMGTGGAPPPPVYCGHPADCPPGQVCSANGTCKPGPCGASNICIYGYSCVSGTCQSPTPGACNSDMDCAPGSLCIAGSNGKGGVCTTQANQCFDQSQCGAGENCVAGKCTLGCSTNADCRDGFTCNTTTSVCSGIAQSCTVTNDCGNANQVCVGGACVPRSMGGQCMNAGDVWTENGCIPNQAASFICQSDGMQSSCATGSICLHHDCWISCDAMTMVPCSTNSQFPVCKPVTEGSTSYNVCGTMTSLGNQCGAGANNMTCTGASICIDGYCK